jgi:hypothetical protein
MEESSGLLERTVPFSVIELHFSYGNTPVNIFVDSLKVTRHRADQIPKPYHLKSRSAKRPKTR